MLIKILLFINLLDFIFFPFYITYIIPEGLWTYDFQQFHRAFHFLQLLFLTSLLFGVVQLSVVSKIIFIIYFIICIQYNFQPEQFFNKSWINGSVLKYSGPYMFRYFGLLASNAVCAGWIYKDILEKHTFHDKDEYDIVCRFSGKTWTFKNYVRNYGMRFVCDILAMIIISNIFIN